MTKANTIKLINDVLGGVTEDGSNYKERLTTMVYKGVTNKVIALLDDKKELTNVLTMIEAYQSNNTISDDKREALYEKTDELVYNALRELMPEVEQITNSETGWGESKFLNMLKQRPDQIRTLEDVFNDPDFDKLTKDI